jgi:hypothetical protein
MGMLKFDIGICVLSAVSLFLWSRGVWRRSRGDVALSGVVFAVSVLTYFRFYPFISLVGLPWILLLGCALVACAAALLPQRERGLGRGLMAAAVFAPVCLAALLFAAERRLGSPSNAIMVIAPYRHAGTWVFDDPRVGLRAEPFVAGMPELIDSLVADAGIEDADKGFRLLFSLRPFPGYQTRVVRRQREAGGTWYYSEKYGAEGWLCPALFKYFRRAPKEIYVKAEAKQASNENPGRS